MKDQLKILLFRYKMQNNLDVHSPLEYEQKENFIFDIIGAVDEIDLNIAIKIGDISE